MIGQCPVCGAVTFNARSANQDCNICFEWFADFIGGA